MIHRIEYDSEHVVYEEVIDMQPLPELTRQDTAWFETELMQSYLEVGRLFRLLTQE